MGNYVHKYFLRDTESEKGKTEAQSSTSTDEKTVDDNVHTPVAQKTLPIDPRSVTSGINRTPIEVYSTPVGVNRKVLSAIPRHLQCKTYLETDLDQLLYLSPKKSAPKVGDDALDSLEEFTTTEMQLTTVDDSIIKRAFTRADKEHYSVLGIDPRSPAADFDRTPPLMPKSMVLLKAKHRENLIRRSYDTDVRYPGFSYCETSSQFNIPEIQALPDLLMCKVRSSNLFNNEVDGRLHESDLSSNHSSETEEDSENKEVESKDESKRISDSCNDVKKNTEHKEVHATSDMIKIWIDSLILDNPTESDLIESQDVHVEEKVSQFPKSKCEINKEGTDTYKKKKKVFKSETKITTDEKKMFNRNDKNGTETTKIRTPLGNRSNNEHIQKILAINSPQQAIKNKSIKPKVSQENSSPHKYITKHKTRDIEWDPDSTVII